MEGIDRQFEDAVILARYSALSEDKRTFRLSQERTVQRVFTLVAAVYAAFFLLEGVEGVETLRAFVFLAGIPLSVLAGALFWTGAVISAMTHTFMMLELQSKRNIDWPATTAAREGGLDIRRNVYPTLGAAILFAGVSIGTVVLYLATRYREFADLDGWIQTIAGLAATVGVLGLVVLFRRLRQELVVIRQAKQTLE